MRKMAAVDTLGERKAVSPMAQQMGLSALEDATGEQLIITEFQGDVTIQMRGSE